MEKIDDEIFSFVFNDPVYQLDKSKTKKQTTSTPEVSTNTERPATPQQVTPTTPSSIQEEFKVHFVNEASDFKGVFVFIHPNNTFSNEDKAFLSSILKAVNLDLNNIHISNTVSNESYAFVKKKYKAKKYFLLNVTPFSLGIQDRNLNKYELTNYDRAFWLSGDALKTIATDVNKKRGLWEGLKRMFF